MIIDGLQPALEDAASAFQSNLYQAIMLELQMKTSVSSLSNFLVALESRSAKFKVSCASICRSCWKLYEDTGDIDYLKIFRDVLCSSTDAKDFVVNYEGDSDSSAALDKFVSFLSSRVFQLDGDETASVDQLGLVLDCCFAVLPILERSKKSDLLKRLCQVRLVYPALIIPGLPSSFQVQQFETQYQFLSRLRREKNESLVEYVPKPEFCTVFMESFKSICSLVAAGSASNEHRQQWRLFSEYLAGSPTQGMETVRFPYGSIKTACLGTLIPSHVAAAALEHLTMLVGANSTGQHLSLVVAMVAQLASEVLVSHQVRIFIPYSSGQQSIILDVAVTFRIYWQPRLDLRWFNNYSTSTALILRNSVVSSAQQCYNVA